MSEILAHHTYISREVQIPPPKLTCTGKLSQNSLEISACPKTQKLSRCEVERSQPAVVLWNERGEHGDGEARTRPRGDSAGVAGGGVWGRGSRGLPQAWDQPADILPVEEEVCGVGIAGAARAATVAR